MATDVAGCAAMVEACRDAKVRLGVAYHMRWHNGHRRVAEMAQAGFFGELRHIRVQWTWPAPDDSNWRAGADVGRWWSLAGVGTHCLDQIRWLMCPDHGEVAEMSATIGRERFKGPHDETALLNFRFESSATAALFVSPVGRTKRWKFTGRAVTPWKRRWGHMGPGRSPRMRAFKSKSVTPMSVKWKTL